MFSFKQIGLITVTVAMSGAAVAQEMRCGNELISGDQIHPLLKTQVLEICGEPTTRDYDRWYYQEQGKILVFNGNDELDHIEDANEE
ncbi:MAG: DUF2845 domain-containing protein [Halieaceae bacterium]|nr:DUF2845 domain-containing protein [Halieaceae bacterium]MCP5148215.1 DUF2845 domain-containing protein [Pseudomonadales bacterium]MCP5188282.1 DUF2845 domain-containing protein [Pseudomonadales bacterium]